MKYPLIVAAALTETRSKKELAEAIATEMPVGTDSNTLRAGLAQIQLDIMEAGGEPRTADTYANYRLTALWVSDNGGHAGSQFNWVPDISFSAHSEARASGAAFEDFSLNPEPAYATRNELRVPPVTASIEVQVQAVGKLLDRPEVRKAFRDTATAVVVAAPLLANAKAEGRKEQREAQEHRNPARSTQPDFDFEEAARAALSPLVDLIRQAELGKWSPSEQLIRQLQVTTDRAAAASTGQLGEDFDVWVAFEQSAR